MSGRADREMSELQGREGLLTSLLNLLCVAEMHGGAGAHQGESAPAALARAAVREATWIARHLLRRARTPDALPDVVDLARAVEDRAETLQGMLPHGANLELTFEPGAWPVLAEEEVVEHVLLELVAHAGAQVDAEDTLGVSVENGLGGDWLGRRHPLGDQEVAVLSVSNTGPGIDPALREGFGLQGVALASARALIEELGGALVVESVPGAGSTLRVLIPRWDSEAERLRALAALAAEEHPEADRELHV